jgi:TetR/AcrR family transcriptional regulator, cholesterol catabolism regulator
MLYEGRSLNARQRAVIARLQREYEAVWVPVLAALAGEDKLKADVGIARLLIFGALNWSVQWFDPKKRASLDDVTDAAMALFLQEK